MAIKHKTSPTSPSGTAIRFIPELDGVRGLAISLVLLFHLQVPLFGIGWCGVDLFFVLSGYLITSILLASKGSQRYFETFYARRILRIFPLYFSALFVVFCVALPIAWHFRMARAVPLTEQLWYWLYLSNWRNASGHIIYYLSHFWTLAVEEQFYLVWPIIVFLLSRRSLASFCLGIVVVCLLLRSILCWDGANTELIHRGTVFRMDALAWGGLIALMNSGEELAGRLRPLLRTGAYVALALLVIILISSGPSALSVPMLSVGYTALGLASASLVWRASANSGRDRLANRILGARPLRELGKYSYGIYVLHYPVVILLLIAKAKVAVRFPLAEETGILLFLTAVVGFGASYAAALLSWNLLEKRVLRFKERFRYAPGAVPQRAYLHAARARREQGSEGVTLPDQV